MLYRLDHIRQAGTFAVCDVLGPVLIHSWKQARARALEVARTDPDGCVTIERIDTAGRLSHAATVYPDGMVTR